VPGELFERPVRPGHGRLRTERSLFVLRQVERRAQFLPDGLECRELDEYRALLPTEEQLATGTDDIPF
jgi:hypothetical protein